MADYTLSYSGEELDEVCEKVQAINPSASDINSFFTNANAITSFFNHKDKLQMRWGTRTFTDSVNSGTLISQRFRFDNIFPDNINIEQLHPIIMVNCDFGDKSFYIDTNIRYTRDPENARSVQGNFSFKSESDKTEIYTMNVYCLVIYTTDGSQGIE